MRDPFITSYKAGGDHTARLLVDAGSDDYRYTVGFVVTAHGVVGVYREAGLTRMTVVAEGREITATIERNLTDRALITACKRFAL